MSGWLRRGRGEAEGQGFLCSGEGAQGPGLKPSSSGAAWKKAATGVGLSVPEKGEESPAQGTHLGTRSVGPGPTAACPSYVNNGMLLRNEKERTTSWSEHG